MLHAYSLVLILVGLRTRYCIVLCVEQSNVDLTSIRLCLTLLLQYNGFDPDSALSADLMKCMRRSCDSKLGEDNRLLCFARQGNRYLNKTDPSTQIEPAPTARCVGAGEPSSRPCKVY